MTTLTVYDMRTYSSTYPYDGSYIDSTTGWADALRSGNGIMYGGAAEYMNPFGSPLTTQEGIAGMVINYSKSGVDYFLYQHSLVFDTSTIGSGQTVSAAVLTLHAYNSQPVTVYAGTNTIGEVHALSFAEPVTSGFARPQTDFTTSTAVATYDYGTAPWGVPGPFAYTSNGNMPGAINHTGVTKFYVIEQSARTGTSLTGTTPVSRVFSIGTNSELSGSTYRPKLVITYSAGTATAAAAATTTGTALVTQRATASGAAAGSATSLATQRATTSVAAAATGTATGSVIVPGTASAAAAATASAVGTAIVTATAAAAGVASAVSALRSPAAASAAAAATATSAVTQRATATAAAAATATGVGTVPTITGTGTAAATTSGTASAIVIVTGIATATLTSLATAQGISIISGHAAANAASTASSLVTLRIQGSATAITTSLATGVAIYQHVPPVVIVKQSAQQVAVKQTPAGIIVKQSNPVVYVSDI